MYRNVTICAIFIGVIIMSGCIPQPDKPAKTRQALISPQAPSIGCAVRVTAPWKAAGQTYHAEAFTDGPDCANAVAILVIRNDQGESRWIDTFNAAQNLALSNAKNSEEMRRALAAWIAQTDLQGKAISATTGDLPVWGENETQPIEGEFPFYPEVQMTREDYTKLKTQKLPMFCYVQGIESEACLALNDGEFEKIGVQSLPG